MKDRVVGKNLTPKTKDGMLSYRYWILALFIAVVFFAGGSSRSEVQSLPFLRPIAVVICGIALLTLKKHAMLHFRIPIIFAMCFVSTNVFQLIPLPFNVHSSFGVMSEVDRAVGLSSIFHEISVAPYSTQNSLFSLFVPLAILLLGVQLDRDERFALLPLLLVLGLFSAFVGAIQIFSDPTGPLYFYDTTNRGASVGLFANRNHQALLLAMLLPMVFVYFSSRSRSEHQIRLGLFTAVAVSAVLVLLILIAGSRVGLFLGLIALVVVLTLYRQNQVLILQQRAVSVKTTFALVAAGVLALTFLTVTMARAEAFDRLMAPDQMEDLRFPVWSRILSAVGNYMPFGTGAGTFATVYRELELDGLLISSYANQAHSDLLDLPLTMGVPGAAFTTMFFVILFAKGVAVLRTGSKPGRHILYQKLGLTLLLLTLLSSLADYPLRTPILATICIVALLWTYADADRVR